MSLPNVLKRAAVSLAVCSALFPVAGRSASETPSPPSQVCANSVCTAAAATSHQVFAWKLVPMNYYANEAAADQVRDDIRSAMELGVNGIGLESYNNGHAVSLMKQWPPAATQLGATGIGFFLILDMAPNTFTAANIISLMETYGNDPHYLKVNGKPLLSAYGGYTAQLGAAWWENNVLKPLANAGHAVTFIPNVDRPQPTATIPSVANWGTLMTSFSPFDGMLMFSPPMGVPFYMTDPNGGHQVWSGLESEENEAAAVHAQKKLFISPYQPYFWADCKTGRPYYEYQGGRGMDNYWRSAITKQKPDLVGLITWDDYSEGTYIQPTRMPLTKYPSIANFPHLGYYELLKYYVQWFKTGTQPTLTKDAMFFFYRTHPANAVATNDKSACSLGPIPSNQKFGLIKDVIYVTTALTSPAELVVTSGGKVERYSVGAGLVTTDVPFSPGKQEFALQRNSTTLTDMISPQQIVAQPVVYNFNLYSGYAIVGGTTSQNWEPSDAWESGQTGTWFK